MEPSVERRAARRYELDLTVTLDGAPGESRNLSSTGLYVLSDRDFAEDARVEVELFFPALPGRSRRVSGFGRVLRTRPEGPRTGVAIELLGWSFA